MADPDDAASGAVHRSSSPASEMEPRSGVGQALGSPVANNTGPEGEDSAGALPGSETVPIASPEPPVHGTSAPIDLPQPSQAEQQEQEGSSSRSGSLFSTGLSVDDNSDADSSVGDVERPSSSVSATSSVFEFVEEYGRTFHKYKEGKYFLPNDIPEQERLDLQHAIAVRLFGKLALAPVDNPPRVLDIGTGTGIWAIEFATANPASDVLGTDLSPIQPEYIPPNCRFEIDDADDQWLFSHRFDYIHARFMIGAFNDFDKIFRYCYDNLNPGGWAEFQDYIAELQCIDGTLAGTALERWNKLFLEAVEIMGRNGRAAAKFRNQMIRAGFVDVVEKKYALPGNPWAKGEREKLLGLMQMTNIMDGLHALSMNLFTKILKWSIEQVEVFLVDVRRDLKDRNIHFYYIVLVVYGRKPLPTNEPQPEAES